MPYHLPGKPDVRLWFSASGSRSLLHRLDERGLDELAHEDGAFLLYGYSANLAQKPDRTALHPEVASALASIGAREDCWRTTVSNLLDRCLATKNLIVTQRRHAYVVSNPTALPITNLQLRSPRRVLYLPSGEELLPDSTGRYHVQELEAGQCLTLYVSAEAAYSGDASGISTIESFRMALEELRHWRGSERVSCDDA